MATTDNTFATADNRQFDLFFQVRPGVLFAYDSPRMIHELDAEVEVLEYVLHSQDPSVTAHGGWKGFFTPGPRSELTLAADLSNGKLNALTSRTSPDQTTVMVLPLGAITTNQADASEYGSWISSKSTRTSESVFSNYTDTNDNAMMPTKTQSAEVGGRLGFEKDFRSNSVALEAGASYLYFNRTAPVGAMPPSGTTTQVDPRGILIWRHDIDRHWSTSVDGGVVYVNPLGAVPDRRAAAFPVFGGLGAYTEAWGRATFALRRAVTPNLFIAQNTVDDSAIAQLAMPLPILDKDQSLRVPKVVGLGSIGAERTQLIDANSSTLQGSFYVARLDLGVSYTPAMGQTYGLRYEFIYQSGNSVATMLIPAYFRNTLYFTFSFRYPDRLAAQVPRRTDSVRADRKDLSPVGAEPVVPDPAEQLPEGEDGEQ